MNKLLVVLLIVACVGLSQSYRKPCGRNMIYKGCGSACPATCEDPDPQICIEICIMGCFCKDGYVLDEGICIRPDQSHSDDSQCPKPHMVWNECGTACEKSCDEQPKYCILMCIAKCVCIEGYVLDNNDNCILPSECPSAVDNTTCLEPNTEYTPCGSACEPTCRYRRPRFCSSVCVEGCKCKKGYIRNDQGDCVHPVQCYKNL